MEFKSWNEYPFSEKRIILNFWFANVNENPEAITKEDRLKFSRLLEQNIDLIMDFVVSLAMIGHNSEIMISLMRNGSLDEVLECVPKMAEDRDFQFVKRQVIALLVGLCNCFMETTDEQEILAKAVPLAAETQKEIKKHYS